MLNEYVAKAIPTIQSGGGRILGFDESPEVVEGELAHPRSVILEFPSRDAFRAWYDSDAYQARRRAYLTECPLSAVPKRPLVLPVLQAFVWVDWRESG
jgi:uncharacterized protein (DUF1330 family)